MEIFISVISGIFSGLFIALEISLFLALAIFLPILLITSTCYISYKVSSKITGLIGCDAYTFEVTVKDKEHQISFVSAIFTFFIFVVLLILENKVFIYLIQYLSDLKRLL